MRVVSSALSVGAEGAVFSCMIVSWYPSDSIIFRRILTASNSTGVNHIAECSALCYTLCVASSIPAREGGVSSMLISFLLSVLAGIVCHYLCKWLDG